MVTADTPVFESFSHCCQPHRSLNKDTHFFSEVEATKVGSNFPSPQQTASGHQRKRFTLLSLTKLYNLCYPILDYFDSRELTRKEGYVFKYIESEILCADSNEQSKSKLARLPSTQFFKGPGAIADWVPSNASELFQLLLYFPRSQNYFFPYHSALHLLVTISSRIIRFQSFGTIERPCSFHSYKNGKPLHLPALFQGLKTYISHLDSTGLRPEYQVAQILWYFSTLTFFVTWGLLLLFSNPALRKLLGLLAAHPLWHIPSWLHLPVLLRELI